MIQATYIHVHEIQLERSHPICYLYVNSLERVLVWHWLGPAALCARYCHISQTVQILPANERMRGIRKVHV